MQATWRGEKMRRVVNRKIEYERKYAKWDAAQPKAIVASVLARNAAKKGKASARMEARLKEKAAAKVEAQIKEWRLKKKAEEENAKNPRSRAAARFQHLRAARAVTVKKPAGGAAGEAAANGGAAADGTAEGGTTVGGSEADTKPVTGLVPKPPAVGRRRAGAAGSESDRGRAFRSDGSARGPAAAGAEPDSADPPVNKRPSHSRMVGLFSRVQRCSRAQRAYVGLQAPAPAPATARTNRRAKAAAAKQKPVMFVLCGTCRQSWCRCKKVKGTGPAWAIGAVTGAEPDSLDTLRTSWADGRNIPRATVENPVAAAASAGLNLAELDLALSGFMATQANSSAAVDKL